MVVGVFDFFGDFVHFVLHFLSVSSVQTTDSGPMDSSLEGSVHLSLYAGVNTTELNNLKRQHHELMTDVQQKDAQIADLRKEQAELERAVADLNRQRVRRKLRSILLSSHQRKAPAPVD
jgi:hypothetical protein